MRLEYRLNFGDYLLFSALHQFLSWRVQAVYLLLAWMVSAGFAARGLIVASMVAAIAYLAAWLVQLAFTAFSLYSSKNKALLTTHIVEVQDQAFYEETQFNRSLHYWPGIARVLKRPGFAAVYINANAAHIIPRRAFASDAQMNEFLALVKQRVRAAQYPG